MLIDKKKIDKVIEIVLLVIMFFIGIRKGGYYKSDSLPLILLIVFLGAIYLILNIKNIKKNNIIFLFLIILALSYWIPLGIKNTATISGAINMAIKISSLSIIYLIFKNSDNKEIIKKWIIISTVIFGILAIDECTFKVLNPILNFLGGGYVTENNDRIAGVMQYSNILALMCLISIIFILYDIFDNKSKTYLKKAIITFLTIIVSLTESKLVIILYIVSFAIFSIKNKKYIAILEGIVNLLYCIIISSLMAIYNPIIVLIFASLFLSLDLYIEYKLKDKRRIINIINICLIVIFAAMVLIILFKQDVGITKSVKEYFTNFYSTKLRFVYYIDSLKLIANTPINFLFGLGGNAFRTMYETVQSTEYISLETHSALLQIFLESGMLGLFSILAIVVYLLKKAKDSKEKLAFLITFIFLCFDVFLTYTFMLYLFVILVSLLEVKDSLFKRWQSALYILFCIGLTIAILVQFIAYMYMPTTIGDLNNTLEEQDKVIKNMEIALRLDPYDLEYRRMYTQALNIYIEILNIKEEIYGADNSLAKQESILKIYDNISRENSFERSNKYTIEDYVYYTYKYLDEIVLIKYAENINVGYEEYLNDMIKKLEKLYNEHMYNDYALDIYAEYLNLICDKYTYVNIMLNDNKITDMLNSLKENKCISL